MKSPRHIRNHLIVPLLLAVTAAARAAPGEGTNPTGNPATAAGTPAPGGNVTAASGNSSVNGDPVDSLFSLLFGWLDPYRATPLSPANSPAHPKGIRYVEAPADGVESVTSHEAVLGAAAGDTLTMRALPIYFMDTTTVAANATLAPTNAHGFVFVVRDATTNQELGWTRMFVDRTNPSSGQLKPNGVARNWTQLATALDYLSALDRVKTGAYEAREVTYTDNTVGSQDFVIWLKSDSGSEDLYYFPLMNGPKNKAHGPVEGKVYTATELLQNLLDYLKHQGVPVAPTPAAAAIRS